MTTDPVSNQDYSPIPLSKSDEKTWAMLAHLSVIINFISGFFGILAALAIYLIFKDRSRYVAYHSMQAFIFQLIWWGGAGVLIGLMWSIVGLLSAIVIGIILIPFALILTFVLLLLPLAALVYGIIGAVQTSQGQEFDYWLIGDWTRNMLES